MAAAIILFLGLLAVSGVTALGSGWSWPMIAGLSIGASALGVVAAQRLRVAGAEGASAYAQLVQTAALLASRTPARAMDAARVLAATVDLREKAPVFVRLKLKPASPQGTASVIAAMSAAPGTVVVDADAGSLLAHVLVEEDVDVAAMQKLERAALAAAGGATP